MNVNKLIFKELSLNKLVKLVTFSAMDDFYVDPLCQ